MFLCFSKIKVVDENRVSEQEDILKSATKLRFFC